MGRRASTKIKVHLELEEIQYQRLAVMANEKNKTVTNFIQTIASELGSTPPEILLPGLDNTAKSDIESNADSSTENEPRKARKR